MTVESRLIKAQRMKDCDAAIEELLSNPSIANSLREAFNRGWNSGRARTLEDAHIAEIDRKIYCAHYEGYSDGHNDGYAEGKKRGYEEGMKRGYEEGMKRGYEEAKINSYRDGYEHGYDVGHFFGFNEALNHYA